MMEISNTSADSGEPDTPDTWVVREGSSYYRHKIPIALHRSCTCPPTHINCLTPKEWLKSQLGVWQFTYEARDVRDKKLHPATFPLSLSKKVIELFTHQGELVLDPFVGSGTTLVAANDTNRNAVGYDLQAGYIALCEQRLRQQPSLFSEAKQFAVEDDARNMSAYLHEESVSLIWTSPPYANLLNRVRKNKSRRDRNNEQLGKVEQYSQDPRDLGTMDIGEYTKLDFIQSVSIAHPFCKAVYRNAQGCMHIAF